MSNSESTSAGAEPTRDAALGEARTHFGEMAGRYSDAWVRTTDKMLAGEYGVKSFNQDVATFWSTWVSDVVNCVRIAGDVAKTFAPPAPPGDT
jgi:hypothetical protein